MSTHCPHERHCPVFTWLKVKSTAELLARRLLRPTARRLRRLSASGGGHSRSKRTHAQWSDAAGHRSFSSERAKGLRCGRNQDLAPKNVFPPAAKTAPSERANVRSPRPRPSLAPLATAPLRETTVPPWDALLSTGEYLFRYLERRSGPRRLVAPRRPKGSRARHAGVERVAYIAGGRHMTEPVRG